jgi:hypothetical protein
VLHTFAEVIAGAVDMRVQNSYAPVVGNEVLANALPPGDYLAACRSEFQPTDYFKRAAKGAAVEALREMFNERLVKEGDLPPASAKKKDFAEVAARLATEHGWLPPQLRCAGYSLAKTAAVGTKKSKRTGRINVEVAA